MPGPGDVLFGELYKEHAPRAWRVARAVTQDSDDACDAVAEAFARVFQAFVAGKLANDAAMGPYLLTATRNAAIDIIRRSRRVDAAGRADALNHVDGSVSPLENVLAEEDNELVNKAFGELPERWRSVLWLIEVERLSTRQAAAVLDLTPNNVAQLAVRARAGLRNRYVQAHVAARIGPECRFTVERLARHANGRLAQRHAAKVEDHLVSCVACRKRLDQLQDLGLTLRHAALPFPLVLRPLLERRWRDAAGWMSSSAPEVPTIGRHLTGAVTGGLPSPETGFVHVAPVAQRLVDLAHHAATGSPGTLRVVARASAGLLTIALSAVGLKDGGGTPSSTRPLSQPAYGPAAAQEAEYRPPAVAPADGRGDHAAAPPLIATPLGGVVTGIRDGVSVQPVPTPALPTTAAPVPTAPVATPELTTTAAAVPVPTALSVPTALVAIPDQAPVPPPPSGLMQPTQALPSPEVAALTPAPGPAEALQTSPHRSASLVPLGR